MCWKRYRQVIPGHYSSPSKTEKDNNLCFCNFKSLTTKHLWHLSILGFAQAGVYAAILSLGDLSSKISEFTALFVFCFLLYALSILLLSRLPSEASGRQGALLLTIVLFSVAFRLTMLSLTPSLSHDVMRFLWDGRLLSHGVNPYLYRPNSTQLDYLKNVPYFEYYEFKNTFTIYPPVAQLLFAASYFVSGNNPVGIKSAVTFFDLLSILLLAAILHRDKSRFDPLSLAVYAWSPLLIVETAGNGHIEPLPLFFLLLSLYFISKKRFRYSSVGYSLACLSKLFPILLLPVYVKHILRTDKGHLKEFISCFAATSMLLLFPVFISSGVNLLYQIGWYSGNITSNASIFSVIHDILLGGQTANSLALGIVYIAFIATIALFLKQRRADTVPEFADNIVMVFGAFLLFSPAVFQWYLIWLLPFLAIKGPDKRNLVWLYFMFAVILPYLPQFSISYDRQTIALLEYVPLYTLLVFSAIISGRFFSKSFQHSVRNDLIQKT